MNTTINELPNGYDDLQSDFYIPPAARKFYIEVKQSSILDHLAMHTSRVIEREALNRANKQVSDGKITNVSLEEITESIASSIEQTEYLIFATIAQHELKLQSALKMADSQEKWIIKNNERIESFRCPICQQSDEVNGGAIIDRSLITGQAKSNEKYGKPVTSIRSCLKCWSVANHQYVQQIAAEVVDGNKTREFKVTNNLLTTQHI